MNIRPPEGWHFSPTGDLVPNEPGFLAERAGADMVPRQRTPTGKGFAHLEPPPRAMQQFNPLTGMVKTTEVKETEVMEDPKFFPATLSEVTELARLLFSIVPKEKIQSTHGAYVRDPATGNTSRVKQTPHDIDTAAEAACVAGLNFCRDYFEMLSSTKDKKGMADTIRAVIERIKPWSTTTEDGLQIAEDLTKMLQELG